MSTGHNPLEFIAKPKTWGFRIARFMYGSRRIIAGLAVVFILFYFLLNNPIFQGYLLKKTNTYLQEKLKTEVRVGRVKIELFSKLVLEDVFLRDLQGDTLISAGKIKANLNFSPSALLAGQYEIDEVSLENIFVHIKRKENQEHNNLQFVIDAFSKPKKEDSKKSDINLNINDLFLSNVTFKSEDVVKGQNIHAFVEDGLIYFNRFDLDKQIIDAHSVILREPFFQLDELTAKPLNIPKKAKTKSQDTTSLKIVVKNFDLQGGHFVFHNYHRSPNWNPDEENIDYDHLNIHDIVLKVNDFSLQKEQYRGEVKLLSLEDRKRFKLNSLKSKSVLVDSTTVQLYDCRLITPQSDIGDTLIMNYRYYRDFNDYNDNVKMEGRFKNSKVALKDIEVFAPQLKTIEPFKNQPDAIFSLNGILKGKVNGLSGKNLTIGVLNKNFLLKGSFNSRNFAVKDEEMLNLKVESLTTDPLTIKRFFPNVNLPKGFERLHNMKIKGSFDGFFADFVADATLYSDLGTVVTDLRMDMRDGSKNALYSGKIEFQNFDLGQYLNDDNLGKISSEVRISEGKNLSFKDGIANLKGKVGSINFKNYVYENLMIDGKLGKNKFDGSLSIDNKDVALQFKGNIDFSNSVPAFHFKSTIDHFDLKKTNLSPKEQVVSAYLDLDIDGDKLSNLNGTAIAKNIKLLDVQSGQEFKMDSVRLNSKAGDGFLSAFELQSELFDARLYGKFRLDDIGAAFRRLLLKNYNGFAQRLNIKEAPVLESQNIGFQISVRQSENWMNLFNIGLDSLSNIQLQGGYDTQSDQLTLNLDADKFKYQDVLFEDIAMKVKNDADQGDALLILRKVVVGNLQLAPILTNYYFKGDTIDFAVSSSSVTSVLDNLNLNGRFNLYEDGYQIKFFPSDLTILQKKWDMAEGNFIRFKKDYIFANDFKLTNEGRIATLHSIQDKGLELTLQNFDIHYLDEIWDYQELEFNGKYTLSVRSSDIFEKKNFTARAWMDSLLINNDNFGQTELKVDWKDFSQLVKANLVIGKDKAAKLKATAQFQPKTNEAQSAKELRLPVNHYSASINLEHYPLKIAEYFIDSGIEQTKGMVEGNLSLNGSIKDVPNISGEAVVNEASTVIKYLNVRYLIDGQKIVINNTLFDATGAILKDTLGNTASVYGGIYHDHFKDFRLGVNISSDKIIALNTTIKENQNYYGFGIGKVDATFSGPFDKTDIGIICNAQKGTKFYIPIKPNVDASTTNFIKFKQNTTQDSELFESGITKAKKKLDKGMSLDMEVNVNPESEVQLIFDEKAGDIMKGRGNGALQLSIPRGRNLSVYGTYTIESGDYLFTLYNFINKPFKVKRGGMIQWNGDPFEAQIDIDADYQGIRTTPYNLISNYLEDISKSNPEPEARRSTAVELTLFLKGRLLKPDISFDVRMPELNPGTVKNLVDQQINLLHQDPNELNRQVFGLIVTGTFLPSTIANFDPVSTVTNTGFNTVSEMVSNQLSNFISDVLRGVVKENSFISGIGFGFNYIYDTGAFRSIANSTSPASSEVALRPTINLFDDKVIINYGFRRGVNENAVYYNHEASVLLSLSEDNRLKMRVYYKNDQDLILGNRNRAGLALSFKEESSNFLKLKKKD